LVFFFPEREFSCLFLPISSSAPSLLPFPIEPDIVNHLSTAKADSSLDKNIALYQSPELLVCDELGYLSLGLLGSNLLFQIFSKRHKQGSTIVTTNLPFAEWGKVFDSTTIAAAIADCPSSTRRSSFSEEQAIEENSKNNPSL
jgi:DNA replication protein DnaC